MSGPISHALLLQQAHYSPQAIANADPDALFRLYTFMVRLRSCEEAIMKEYHPANEMRCPIHFCLGQEAVPAALSLTLEADDYLFSHHRSHGYYLAKGAPMKALVAELYGRATGANGGKAGSQDISYANRRFYSGAILTGAVALSVGSALAAQLQGTRCVTVAGFGEAATEEGIFWEAINYASLRQLPLVLLCENNRYSMYSPQLKRQPADDIARRVAAFGLRTRTIFGNDAPLVYQSVREALQLARQGQGPTFIEAYTYRWNGHVGPESDDWLDYRPAEELAFWKAHCPILLLEQSMLKEGLTLPDKSRLLDTVQQEIEEAFRFAKASPFPTVDHWQQLNTATASPLADKLLSSLDASRFDGHQAEAVPGPY
jgi:TPP-dependent pyruvate/acetoin dehydrogenase alpha subunit